MTDNKSKIRENKKQEEDKNKRNEIYDFIYELEFNLLKLIKPDIVIFLHMPTKFALELRKNRTSLDEHEKSIKHLTMAETSYLELKDKYGFRIKLYFKILVLLLLQIQ